MSIRDQLRLNRRFEDEQEDAAPGGLLVDSDLHFLTQIQMIAMENLIAGLETCGADERAI